MRGSTSALCAVFFACVLTNLFVGCGKESKIEKESNVQTNIHTQTAPAEPVNPTDQLALAYKYYLGEEIPTDHDRAIMLFRKAADNGSSEAQFALGCMYQNGQGVTQNYRDAAQWYLKSAEAGNANGQYLIGLSLKEGSGMPKDPIESYKWIHLAAQQGLDNRHIEARDQLALLLPPSMVAEGRRRADQFMMYQGVGN
jgi:TPR repeat protein|tara:strand:- start:893 stop:1486 length:594 start_codon:yes stop_codon:yes gene_type:complete